MRRLIKWLVLVGLLAGVVAGIAGPGMAWYSAMAPRYLKASVNRGRVETVVNSTGTVKAVQSISVGSFVSGPIKKIHVDFNYPIWEGQLLAEIDPKLFDAAVRRDKASLQSQRSEKKRVQALLEQAKNNETRAMNLRDINKDFLSDNERDQVLFNRQSLEAQLGLAEASIEQAQASLENSAANLGYTRITSPVDGIVIERKVDDGQTVASQFQTPEMFIVAPDMEKVHIFASVDEADIGLIYSAQVSKRPVRFTVDAYPQDLFSGMIYQVRKNSTTTQNVVTYPVVISSDNPIVTTSENPNAKIGEPLNATASLKPRYRYCATVADLCATGCQTLTATPWMMAVKSYSLSKIGGEPRKLMPGMTANLTFLIDSRENVVRVPVAALRFLPPVARVRPEDRKYLDGTAAADEAAKSGVRMSADQKVDLAKQRSRRIVWVQEGNMLKAIRVVLGVSDNQYAELIEGDLTEDQELVTGIDTSPQRP